MRQNKFWQAIGGLAAVVACVVVTACGAPSDDAATDQSPPASTSGTSASARPQPSPNVDARCNSLPLTAKEVADALDTTVTSGTYAAGVNSQGAGTVSCSYTTSMRRPGGKSDQDVRVVYVVREPHGTATWNQLAASMSDGVDVVVNNTDGARANPPTKLPFVIYRQGKEVVHITFLAESGTKDGQDEVLVLAGVAANP